MSKNKHLKYKDYYGSVEVDVDNNVLYGKILFINDTVTYESDAPGSLKIEFEAAVDDYLATCEVIGKEPQKTYSGTFNVRVGEELHREAVICAMKKNVKLNELCREALVEKIKAIKAADAEVTTVLKINVLDSSVVNPSQDDLKIGVEYRTLSSGGEAGNLEELTH